MTRISTVEGLESILPIPNLQVVVVTVGATLEEAEATEVEDMQLEDTAGVVSCLPQSCLAALSSCHVRHKLTYDHTMKHSR